jgi:hypothetical protein
MRIDKKKVFCELLDYKLPESQQLISELFRSFDIRVRELNANDGRIEQRTWRLV